MAKAAPWCATEGFQRKKVSNCLDILGVRKTVGPVPEPPYVAPRPIWRTCFDLTASNLTASKGIVVMPEDRSSIWDRLCTSAEERPFLEALMACRHDRQIRDAYIHWLVGRDDLRAEYLRLMWQDEGEWERHQQRCEVSRARMTELAPAMDSLWIACVRESVRARVIRTTDHSVYVDLGGVEGEVDIRDMSS